MRRLLSISLLLVMFSTLLAPLLALGGSSEARLALCCRKGGAHHCETGMAGGDGSARVSAPCPMYAPGGAVVQGGAVTFAAPVGLFAEAVSHPAMRRQAEARARIALDRGRQKRGPPVDLLS